MVLLALLLRCVWGGGRVSVTFALLTIVEIIVFIGLSLVATAVDAWCIVSPSRLFSPLIETLVIVASLTPSLMMTMVTVVSGVPSLMQIGDYFIYYSHVNGVGSV